MWSCDQCGAEGEEHFEVCWQCGAPRAGVVGDAEAGQVTESENEAAPGEAQLPHGAAETLPASEVPEPPQDPNVRTCIACGAELDYRGEIPIRVGGPVDWALFREGSELSEKLWPVHVWACCGCRRLEFFEAE